MSNRGTKAASEARWCKSQYQMGRLHGEAGQPAVFADAYYQRGHRRGYRVFQMNTPVHAYNKLSGELTSYINDAQRQADRHLDRVKRLDDIRKSFNKIKEPKGWKESSKVKLVIGRYYITRRKYLKKYSEPVLMKWTENGFETIVGPIQDFLDKNLEVAV